MAAKAGEFCRSLPPRLRGAAATLLTHSRRSAATFADLVPKHVIRGPIYALATTESVTVPIDAVLWLDNDNGA